MKRADTSTRMRHYSHKLFRMQFDSEFTKFNFIKHKDLEDGLTSSLDGTHAKHSSHG